MYVREFFTLAIIHLLALAAPGPDVLLVIRQYVTFGSRLAVFTTCGIALGIVFQTIVTVSGMAVALLAIPTALVTLKWIGASYLALIGWKTFCGAERQELVAGRIDGKAGSGFQALTAGLLTNVFNPKVTLFFIATFSTVVARQTPQSVRLLYCAWIALATFLWFFGLIMILQISSGTFLTFLQSRGLSRVLGILIILFAVGLVLR